MVVRVKKTAELDDQVKILAGEAGYSPEEAQGRLVNLWAHCLRDKTEVLAEKHIRAHMGPRGVDALIESELAFRSDDGIQVRGVRKELDERYRRTVAARQAALARHGGEVMETGPEAPAVVDAPRKPDRVCDASATRSVADAPNLFSDLQISGSESQTSEASSSSETPRDLKQQGASQKRKSKTKVAEHPMPADFRPGEWHRNYARENALDIDREFDRFCDRNEATGRLYASWPAALRTWLKNAVEWRDERQASQPNQTGIRTIPKL